MAPERKQALKSQAPRRHSNTYEVLDDEAWKVPEDSVRKRKPGPGLSTSRSFTDRPPKAGRSTSTGQSELTVDRPSTPVLEQEGTARQNGTSGLKPLPPPKASLSGANPALALADLRMT